jgi:pimeloyl-ACP methyl ester carboxylesterase
MTVVLAILLLLFAGIVLYISVAGPKLPPETDEIIERVMTNELPELVTGKAGFTTQTGLQIWYESIAPEGAAKGMVLLIMSLGGSAIEWSRKFIRVFIDSGYQVIRYDHRGTGLSDRVENWDRKNPYTVADMAGDAVAVLDVLGVQQVHLIGHSMGGMIAQEIAIRHPERVATLTLLSTSGYIGDPDLRSISSGYFISALLKGMPLFKYRILGGEKNLVKERIAKLKVMLGYADVDVQEIAEVVLYDLRKRRGVSIKGALQHQAAVTISGSRYEQLKTLDVPTLVVHGTADPLIPVEHGKKLVELVANAEGLWLDGVDHIFPYPNMDAVNKKIIAHLRNACEFS